MYPIGFKAPHKAPPTAVFRNLIEVSNWKGSATGNVATLEKWQRFTWNLGCLIRELWWTGLFVYTPFGAARRQPICDESHEIRRALNRSIQRKWSERTTGSWQRPLEGMNEMNEAERRRKRFYFLLILYTYNNKDRREENAHSTLVWMHKCQLIIWLEWGCCKKRKLPN